MTKNKIKIFFIVLLLSPFSFAQTKGNSGLSFLKFSFGARNAALGDAGAVFANDVTSLFYNPARLANNGGAEAMFIHNSWVQGIRSEMAGAKASLFGQPVALGLNATTINDIEVRTQPGDPITKFNANYFSGSIGTGFNIAPRLDAGFSIKYLYENIFVDEANGWGLDLGLFYRTIIEGLDFSASIRNIGSMNSLRNTDTKLPTEIRAGASYQIELQESKLDFTAGGEFLRFTRDRENHLNFGGEITYAKTFSLRGGFQSNYQTKGITAGMGLIWGNLIFDYAYMPFKLGLGNANMFSVQFKF